MALEDLTEDFARRILLSELQSCTNAMQYGCGTLRPEAEILQLILVFIQIRSMTAFYEYHNTEAVGDTLEL